VGTRGSFPGGKAAGVWSWLLPSSAEVRNAWSYTYTPPIRLRGVVLRGSTGTTFPWIIYVINVFLKSLDVLTYSKAVSAVFLCVMILPCILARHKHMLSVLWV
jgi:hypothetical protein